MVERRQVQAGFFDAMNRLEELSKQGDPLEKLSAHVDWECFRMLLERAVRDAHRDPSKGGRPPYDAVMMFKILVLQHLYGLADERTEFAIKDRLSFMRFLQLTLKDKVPDEKTIWFFRESLAQQGVIERLFRKFDRQLERVGLIAHKGSIVDATFVEVPRQHNSRDDNDDIRSGKTPDAWKDEPAKLRQKDVDARWAKKYGENHFGYKNHVKVDQKSKLITAYTTTAANVHDSRALMDLLDDDDAHHSLYGDCAYRSKAIGQELQRREIRNRFQEQGRRNKPLSLEQAERNRRRSRIRVRVEHVFGFMENSLKVTVLRYIGGIRAAAAIGMRNLVYNLCRLVQLQRA